MQSFITENISSKPLGKAMTNSLYYIHLKHIPWLCAPNELGRNGICLLTARYE